jgi:hypothetical protein
MVTLVGGKWQEGTDIHLRSMHRAAAAPLTGGLQKVYLFPKSRETGFSDTDFSAFQPTILEEDLSGTGCVPETDPRIYWLLPHLAKHDYEIHYPGQCGQQAKDHASENKEVKSAESCRKSWEAKLCHGVDRRENCPGGDAGKKTSTGRFHEPTGRYKP